MRTGVIGSPRGGELMFWEISLNQSLSSTKASTARGKELSLNTMKWLLLTIRTLQTINKIKSN